MWTDKEHAIATKFITAHSFNRGCLRKVLLRIGSSGEQVLVVNHRFGLFGSDRALSDVVESGADGQPPVSFPLGGDVVQHDYIFQREFFVDIVHLLDLWRAGGRVFFVVIVGLPGCCQSSSSLGQTGSVTYVSPSHQWVGKGNMALGFGFLGDGSHLSLWIMATASNVSFPGRDRTVDLSLRLDFVELASANIFPAAPNLIHGSITQRHGYAAPWHSKSNQFSEEPVFSCGPGTVRLVGCSRV